MPDVSDHARALLRLTLVPGVGPVLAARLLDAFATPHAVFEAAPAQLERVQGIGPRTASSIAAGFARSADAAAQELEHAARLDVHILGRGDAEYPPLLARIADPPPILYVQGELTYEDRLCAGIVGARECSAYGIEQAERFGAALALAAVSVVSGGARGIDAAAHRGALRAGGRTLAIVGSGLAECYPPEHAEMYHQIAAGRGAVISELPLTTPARAENFPARNRLISGLSLVLLVIEASLRSGALITARLAAEEHGRDVLALPGRVDSPASRGTHHLLKSSGAQLATEPGDVLAAIAAAARTLLPGADAALERAPTRDLADTDRNSAASAAGSDLFAPDAPTPERAPAAPTGGLADSPVLAALRAARRGMTLDELAAATGLEPAGLRAEITLLEIQRRVARAGATISRVL